MEEKHPDEVMVDCRDCKGTGKVPPETFAKGCQGCPGCDCERCKGSGKIVWIEEVIRKEDSNEEY